MSIAVFVWRGRKGCVLLSTHRGVLKGKLPVLMQTLYLSLFVQVDPDLWQNSWGSSTWCLFLDFDLEPSIWWTGSSPWVFSLTSRTLFIFLCTRINLLTLSRDVSL